MGVIAKIGTNRTVRPQTVPIGSWLSTDPSGGRLPVEKLLWSCVLAAVLRTEIGRKDDMYGRYLHAAHYGDHATIALDGERLVKAWTLHVQYDGAQAHLTVPTYLTSDNALVVDKALDALRQNITDVLQSGPQLSVAPGPPEVGPLVTKTISRKAPMLATAEQWFTDDFLAPTPPGMCHGAAITLPVGSGPAVIEAIDASNVLWSAAGENGVRAVYLDGGRTNTDQIVLAHDGDTPSLHLRLESLASASLTGQARAVHAAFFALASIGRQLAKTDPTAAQVITDWVDAVHRPLDDPERFESLTQEWADGRTSETVAVTPGMTVPIALRIVSRVNPLRPMVASSSWTVGRTRSSGGNMSKRKRAKESPKYWTRRVAMVTVNGALKPIFRYVLLNDGDLRRSVSADAGEEPWYWQVGIDTRDRAETDETYDSVAMITALSQGDGDIAYGTELYSMWRGAVRVTHGKDPAAQIETVWLTV